MRVLHLRHLISVHFLYRILIWVDPISCMAILFKDMQITSHLCLLGHHKYLSTSGGKVKLSGEFADVSVGKAYGKSDSALIKTALDFVKEEAIE